MANVQYEKIVGETFYEANLLAEKNFGKGNFDVITSKRIKRPIYLGLGHKELVELTIAVRAKDNKSNAPSRPLPSVEVSLPKTVFARPSEDGSLNDNKPAADISPTYLPPAMGAKAYAEQKEAPRKMRNVHDMRSIQEGDQAPQPQKSEKDESIEPQHIQDILAKMLELKDERKRRDRIANVSGDRNTRSATMFSAKEAPAAATPAPSAPTNLSFIPPVIDPGEAMKFMQQQMNQIMEVLQNMNKDSSRALEREIPDLPKGLFEVKKSLLAMETPMDITDQMVFDLKDCLPSRALKYPSEALKETCNWLERRLKFSPELDFPENGGPKIVVLLGPTGVGKTTTIAKLAASYGLNMKDSKSIALFTLDTFRIGATEQLHHYAQIIDMDMEILYRPEDIDQAVHRHLDKDLIIVDTAGRCQKDSDELCELRSFIERLPEPSRYLVISATTKYSDMLDTIQCFGKVGFDHLIFTKTDETNTVGPLLAILFTTGKSLAFITNGQKVPEDFRKADFDFFNSRMLID